jgi:hypothetical protein
MGRWEASHRTEADWKLYGRMLNSHEWENPFGGRVWTCRICGLEQIRNSRSGEHMSLRYADGRKVSGWTNGTASKGWEYPPRCEGENDGVRTVFDDGSPPITQAEIDEAIRLGVQLGRTRHEIRKGIAAAKKGTGT